jgi:hypothetical protein
MEATIVTKKKDSATYKPGDQVILKANEEEGWKEEEAEVIEHEGVGLYMVRLLPKYLSGKTDDGLREVNEDQMVLKLAKKGKV